MALILNTYSRGTMAVTMEATTRAKSTSKTVWGVFLKDYLQSSHNECAQTNAEELNIIGLSSLQKAEPYLSATSKAKLCISVARLCDKL